MVDGSQRSLPLAAAAPAPMMMMMIANWIHLGLSAEVVAERVCLGRRGHAGASAVDLAGVGIPET